MENILSVGQAVLVWGVVFAPVLAILLAVMRGTNAPEERGRTT